MKIKRDKDSPVEYVKLEKCTDCGNVVFRDDGEEVMGSEFLANNYILIELERGEIGLFNEFLEDARVRMRIGWDFSSYIIDRDLENSESEEGEEK